MGTRDRPVQLDGDHHSCLHITDALRVQNQQNPNSCPNRDSQFHFTPCIQLLTLERDQACLRCRSCLVQQGSYSLQMRSRSQLGIHSLWASLKSHSISVWLQRAIKFCPKWEHSCELGSESLPKVCFRSSKLKRMAAVRHGAKGITIENSPPGSRVGRRLVPNWARKFSPSTHALFGFVGVFLPPLLLFPFMIEGEGKSRSHQLYFGARSINSSAQWWQGCSVEHIWGSRKSGAGPDLKEAHFSPVFKSTKAGTPRTEYFVWKSYIRWQGRPR